MYDNYDNMVNGYEQSRALNANICYGHVGLSDHTGGVT